MALYLLNEKDVREIRRVLAWIEKFNVSGDGVSFRNDGRACSVGVSQKPGGRPGGAASPPVLAKITGIGATDGYYEAAEALADGTAKTGGRTWTTATLGEVYDPNGSADSWYVQGKPLIVRLARGAKSDGTPLWYIANVLGTMVAPATLGGTTEGTTTADTETWNQAAQAAGEDGVTVSTVSRVVYDDAGDETLYAMVRTLTFDSLGHLREISAETAVSVDVPEECA